MRIEERFTAPQSLEAAVTQFWLRMKLKGYTVLGSITAERQANLFSPDDDVIVYANVRRRYGAQS